jgi:hypothetical protein
MPSVSPFRVTGMTRNTMIEMVTEASTTLKLKQVSSIKIESKLDKSEWFSSLRPLQSQFGVI